MEYNGRGAVGNQVSWKERDDGSEGRTERSDKYKGKKDSKTKVLVVAQPVGEVIKALMHTPGMKTYEFSTAHRRVEIGEPMD